MHDYFSAHMRSEENFQEFLLFHIGPRASSGHQSPWQVPLPTALTHCPCRFCFKTMLSNSRARLKFQQLGGLKQEDRVPSPELHRPCHRKIMKKNGKEKQMET